MCALFKRAKHHFTRNRTTGRVIRIANKHHISGIGYAIQQCDVNVKAVLGAQQMIHDCAAGEFKRRFIFGKCGRRHKRAARLFAQSEAEYQVGRAVAADHVFDLNAFMCCDRCAQLSAERVGIRVGRFGCLADRVFNVLGHAERVAVGRKVKREDSVFNCVAVYVAAVGQSHMISPFNTESSASAAKLAAYIIRFAYRISSGVIGRSASPMNGFSASLPK
ncbi:hypothetical protein SDC9_156386 [bioreactor metagenome]|uniref:Uncharacterized protein n=1 Tax=bioreactor metagenome TaxID=1076179 RepID=A0A645F421_9ZZZZ